MTDPASGELDEFDWEILDRLAAVHTTLDPPPENLDVLVRFAIAVDGAEVEVARLEEQLLTGSGARATEHARTVTFVCASRTIMVTIADTPDDRVRIDGWLAPAAVVHVELRRAGESPTVVRSDATGRFVFDGVAHGLVQFVVHPAEDSTASRVVTPALAL